MARIDETDSGDRIRRSVRLDLAEWLALCRIADAYWDAKRHPATDAAIIDALAEPVAFPAAPTQAFNDALTTFVEGVAQRLNQATKKFHYGEDTVKALFAAAEVFPKVDRGPGDPLPFVRRLPSGNPAVPTAPWAITVPLQFAARLPETDLRPFVEAALVAKAERLNLGTPQKLLPLPKCLPSLESVRTTRYLDESMVAIIAALPLVAPIPDERLEITLRWLLSALRLRGM